VKYVLYKVKHVILMLD